MLLTLKDKVKDRYDLKQRLSYLEFIHIDIFDKRKRLSNVWSWNYCSLLLVLVHTKKAL